MFKDKRIALYITGGIAAYKSIILLRELIKQGAHVKVAMTHHATKFVTPLTFSVLSGYEVYVDTFELSHPEAIDHIALASWADYSIVAPATANIMAKVAHGIADDFVSTSLLATEHALCFVPAMNDKMYANPATKRNIRQLSEDGHWVMTPDVGYLAEGYHAQGRFPEYKRILDEFGYMIAQGNPIFNGLKSKRVVITAGGTVEPIDPVRVLTNKSSGKMGHALAEAALEAGAEVTLITTSQVPVSSLIKRIEVKSAAEMLEAVTEMFATSDILIMAAAVSDYRPLNPATQKLKKQPNLTLELIPNPDILAICGENKKECQWTIGFAAETEHLDHYAVGKLAKKKADMIIANDVSRSDSGLESDDNEVTIFTREGQHVSLPKASKTTLARVIVKYISKYIAGNDIV